MYILSPESDHSGKDTGNTPVPEVEVKKESNIINSLMEQLTQMKKKNDALVRLILLPYWVTNFLKQTQKLFESVLKFEFWQFLWLYEIGYFQSVHWNHRKSRKFHWNKSFKLIKKVSF